MNVPFWMTLATGLIVLLSSFFVGLLEILSGPDRLNYPTARLHVRVAMFTWDTLLAYRGMEIIGLLLSPSPQYVTAGTAFGSIALLLVQAALLEHQLRCWLPAVTQQRIQQLIAIASCRKPGGVVIKGLKARVSP